MKNKKRVLDVIRFWFIMLIATTPFYTSAALAVNLQVTKNTGVKNLDGYLDGKGDNWNIEVQLTDTLQSEINPSDVQISLGGKQRPFQACSSTETGIVCTYSSALTAFIKEGTYPFQVIYTYLDELNKETSKSSAQQTIKVDSSAPLISFIKAKQQGKDVLLTFTADDRSQENLPAVGLQEVKIIDAESAEILQTITEFPDPEKLVWEDQKLESQLSGEGKRRIKISAVDLLGHESASSVFSFTTDFIPPEIRSLNLTNLDKFIPADFSQKTDIMVDVYEQNLLDSSKVLASSEQADLKDTSADECKEDESEARLWHCLWEDVKVNPAESISIDFTVTDENGNKATKTLTRSGLVQDGEGPEIVYFGTVDSYNDQYYVKKGENSVMLKVKDAGSGINKDTLIVDLSKLGGSSQTRYDDKSCNNENEITTCVWKVSLQGVSQLRASVVKLEDNVGNSAKLQDFEPILDNSAPIVEKVEILGGEKEYYQSNDQIKINLEATESSGLVVLVNINDLVNDAVINYPENVYNHEAGWMIFTDKDCQKTDSGTFVCSLSTPEIRSGHDQAQMRVMVLDTAGNQAVEWIKEQKQLGSKGKYEIEILGLVEEANPDYWEVKKVNNLVDFIDLDATEIAPSRMPVEVVLGTKNQFAKVIDTELVNCIPSDVVSVPEVKESSKDENVKAEDVKSAKPESTPEPSVSRNTAAPEVQRSVIYQGVSVEGETQPKPRIVMEFVPFNGREMFSIGEDKSENFEEVLLEYTCNLRIFTKVGDTAINSAEMQEVKIKVPFGFSKLGSADENLDAKINDLKDDVFNDAFSVLDVINQVITWARWAKGIISIVNDVMTIYNVFESGLSLVEDVPILTPVVKATCVSTSAVEYNVIKRAEWIQIPLAILNCDPRAQDKKGESETLLGVYGDYQKFVLDAYNVWSGRGLLGLPAKSLYENIWTSTIGLCAPGIIYNVDKWRQVQCREILCYQQDIPLGVATMDSCQKMTDYLDCRYWEGSFFATIAPLAGAVDGVMDFIKGWFSSPIGLVRAGLTLTCSASCAAGIGAKAVCTFTTVITKIGDIVDTIAGAIQTIPTQTSDPYCSQVEQLSKQKK